MGSFDDSTIESAYRNNTLDTDRTLIQLVCAIILIVNAGFLFNDLQDSALRSSEWITVLAFRCGFVAAVVIYMRMLRRVTDARKMDALTVIIIYTAFLLLLWVDASRPKDFFTHVGADVVVLITVYLVVPVAQPIRLIAAVSLTIALLVLYLVYKEPPYTLTSVSGVGTLLFANTMGILMSTRLSRLQRAQYFSLKLEKRARQELEDAQSEIKSLAGMIPICAGCKKIRNDDGFWEQVETYIRDRTEAEFSHGMCPDCEKEYGF
jgi:hypothetical protein